MQAEGIVAELILLDGLPAARIVCAPALIPAPGKYLLASAGGSDAPLAASVFSAGIFSDGFLTAPPTSASWTLGMRLHLRGPLGYGFEVPTSAKRVALIAFDDLPWRLLALLNIAFKQDASVTLVCELPPDDLPLQVEVQPLSALREVYSWADYAALDAARESLSDLKSRLRNPLRAPAEAQILVRVPMPCGALSECGVCAIDALDGRRLVCDDGPVFNLKDLI